MPRYGADKATGRFWLPVPPGVSAHAGADWYVLAGVEVPLTRPEPFDYRVLAGLMKVW